MDGLCSLLTELDCGARGGSYQEFNTCDDGSNICAEGACCSSDGSCARSSPSGCDISGGDYQGDDTGCDPNLCPQPTTGACCLGDACQAVTASDCADADGFFLGLGRDCGSVMCEPGLGACCTGGSCSERTANDCDAIGGTFVSEGIACADTDCTDSTP